MIIIICTTTQAPTSFISTDEHHMDAQCKRGASGCALVAAIAVIGLAVGCKEASGTVRGHVSVVKGELEEIVHQTNSHKIPFSLPSQHTKSHPIPAHAGNVAGVNRRVC
jgi:hypothetical protein